MYSLAWWFSYVQGTCPKHRCSLGCVLSPLLFSVYTNEIICNNAVLQLIKYADDIALTACLKDE